MLKIIVCIKQVPLSQNIQMDPERGTLIRDSIEVGMNPYDKYAIEAALKIKDKVDSDVLAFTMGPPSASQVLREAYAMGIDKVYLVSDIAFAGADVFATTYTLANAIHATQSDDFDLIICGRQTTDGDTAQVGPSLAGQLGIPCISWVQEIIEIDDVKGLINYKDDEGFTQALVKFPCLISVDTTIGMPRMSTLFRKMESRKLQIQTVNLEDMKVPDPNLFGLQASPTRVIDLFTPQHEKLGDVLQGSLSENIEFICNKIFEIK